MLDPNLFAEVMAQLVDYYPESRINNDGDRWDRTVGEWFKDFKKFDNSEFLDGIKFQRESQSKRFPAIPDLIIKIREAKQIKIKADISSHEASQVRYGYQPRDIIDPEEKSITRDILSVLRVGVTPEAWRNLADKYRDVPNSSNPGTKFGSYFDEAADDLEAT